MEPLSWDDNSGWDVGDDWESVGVNSSVKETNFVSMILEDYNIY